MIIKENQLEKFNQDKLDKFIIQTTGFLRKNFEPWAAAMSDEDIKNQVLLMIAWAAAYEIDAGLNIQKLLHHKIEFGWELPLHEKLEKILVNYKYDQHKRVNDFCLQVESKRYKLTEVNLETNLKQISIN